MKLLKITLVCAALALTACGKKKKSDDKKSGGNPPTAQGKTIDGKVSASFKVKFDFAQTNGTTVVDPAGEGGPVDNPSAKPGKVAACTVNSPGAETDGGKIKIEIAADDKKQLVIEQAGTLGLKFMANKDIELAGDNKSNTEQLFEALTAEGLAFADIKVESKDKKKSQVLSLTVEKSETENHLDFTLSAKCTEKLEEKKD